jgi:hypothetical protein
MVEMLVAMSGLPELSHICDIWPAEVKQAIM